MRNMKDVLRLKYVGKLSHERISVALGVSKGVVTKYAGLASVAGLNWALVHPMDEVQLHNRRINNVAPQSAFVLPNYGLIHQELRRKGMTLMLLWEWHAWVGDATIADAILDRIMQRNHRFTLTGDSLRQKPKISKKEQKPDPS